jgi:hypothetical protein
MTHPSASDSELRIPLARPWAALLIPALQPPGNSKEPGPGLICPGANDNQQIEAYLLRIDEPFQTSEKYVAMMKRNYTQGMAQNSYWRVLAIEFEPDANKPRCARGHIVLRDKSPAADADARFSEQYLLSCALDKREPFGIEVRYYNRYKGGERDPGFTTLASKLIDSVEVNDR